MFPRVLLLLSVPLVPLLYVPALRSAFEGALKVTPKVFLSSYEIRVLSCVLFSMRVSERQHLPGDGCVLLRVQPMS